jgi:hypothetical protein
MRILFLILFLAVCAAAHASSTLRVGNQVLTAGDSQERVTDLLGRPTSKSHKRPTRRHGGRGVRVLSGDEGGEQWRYRRDGHITVVTIIGGRVTNIQDDRL